MDWNLISAGDKLGPYEILKAHDLRWNSDVAITNAEFSKRFEREVVASDEIEGALSVTEYYALPAGSSKASGFADPM